MAKKDQSYAVFYDNNERAKNISASYFEHYLNLVDFQLKQGESLIKIDLIMKHVLDEFETANGQGKQPRSVTGKDFHEYLKKIKKKIKFAEELKKMRNYDYEKFTFSSIWLAFSAFLVILFLKEVLSERYLLGYYVDLIVAAISLYIGASNLCQHQKLIRRWNFSYRSLVIMVVGMIVSIGLMLFTLESPFDVTFVILVIAHISSKTTIKKEFEQAC